MAAMSGAWLRKKVRHPWLGGPHRLTMYLATLDCATSNPSLSSSPWMRGGRGYPGQFHSRSSSAQNQQNPHWSLTVSSNLCVAVPDGATELERLRDRNQGIAPPSNADLIAIIRATDDLICQLKLAALETDRLRDRVERLEQLVGVDRSLASRLRAGVALEPGAAYGIGMVPRRAV